MARRIVIIGPNNNGTVPCLEIEYPMDAVGMIKDGVVRVTMSKYDGVLSDATVLTWPEELARARDTNKAADQWWQRVTDYTKGLVKAREFTLRREDFVGA